MAANISPRSVGLGVLGAAIGGTIGHFAFQWAMRQGFHVIMLPPMLLGLGAGYLAGVRSQPFAIASAVMGLALGLFTEWRFFPFIKDGSFLYFVTHIYQLKPIVLLLLAGGTFMSYRLALGWDQRSDVSGQGG